MGVAAGLWMCLFLAALSGAGASVGSPCGPNPGGQKVKRDDGSTYPYFGMSCARGSDCGNCDLDELCVCTAKCCAPRAGPPGYACLPNGTDLVGEVCVDKGVGPGKSLAELGKLCDAAREAGAGGTTEGCQGFNTNGFLKKCVRGSCGARPSHLPGDPLLVSCVSVDTPVDQPHPKGKDPSCHGGHGPAPSPPAGPAHPYGGGCAGTWNQTDCNCSGVHPPFGAPAHTVPLQKDYHFPSTEAAEKAALVVPALVSATAGSAV